jgi:hypothetical protein
MITIEATLHCDHNGCQHTATALLALATDGRLVAGRFPDNWEVGEDSESHDRRAIALCPVHAERNAATEAIRDAVKGFVGQPLSPDGLLAVQQRLHAVLTELQSSGYIPRDSVVGSKVETDGTITISINDARGPVRPDDLSYTADGYETPAGCWDTCTDCGPEGAEECCYGHEPEKGQGDQ